MKWTHDDLMHDLAGHLRANTDRVVWCNMQMGPSGSPRPDCYTIQKTYRHDKFKPIAYECKISVADFRSDVTAGKWMNYLKFSSGVIFAVPQGLINKADIPPMAGMIVRSESGWRTMKGPTLKPCELKHEHFMKLIIDGIDREVERASRTRDRSMNKWLFEEKVRKKFGDELADILKDRHQLEWLKDYNEKTRKQEEESHRQLCDKQRERHRNEWDGLRREADEYLTKVRDMLGYPEGTQPRAVINGLRNAMWEIDERRNFDLRQHLERTKNEIARMIRELEPPIPVEAPCTPPN